MAEAGRGGRLGGLLAARFDGLERGEGRPRPAHRPAPAGGRGAVRHVRRLLAQAAAQRGVSDAPMRIAQFVQEINLELGDEAYDLSAVSYIVIPGKLNHSWDVPEGGSEAIILVRRAGPADFHFVVN